MIFKSSVTKVLVLSISKIVTVGGRVFKLNGCVIIARFGKEELYTDENQLFGDQNAKLKTACAEKLTARIVRNRFVLIF